MVTASQRLHIRNHRGNNFEIKGDHPGRSWRVRRGVSIYPHKTVTVIIAAFPRVRNDVRPQTPAGHYTGCMYLCLDQESWCRLHRPACAYKSAHGDSIQNADHHQPDVHLAVSSSHAIVITVARLLRGTPAPT